MASKIFEEMIKKMNSLPRNPYVPPTPEEIRRGEYRDRVEEECKNAYWKWEDDLNRKRISRKEMKIILKRV